MPLAVEVLIEQANFSLIVMNAKAAFSEAWIAHKQATEKSMRRASPFLRLIPQWEAREMAAVKTAFMKVRKVYFVHTY